MKNLILIILIFSQSAFASDDQIIFRCKTAISIFDPNFVQGSEVYMNILWSEEDKAYSVLNLPAEGSPQKIMDSTEQNRFVTEPEERLFVEWVHGEEKPYISMFRYSETGWGLAIHLSSLARERSSDLMDKNEVELHCQQQNKLP